MSCLVVPRDRPAFAARAIGCFADQRYPTARQHEITEVAILDAAHDMTLDALRNRSLDAASGDLVWVWDDDRRERTSHTSLDDIFRELRSSQVCGSDGSTFYVEKDVA